MRAPVASHCEQGRGACAGAGAGAQRAAPHALAAARQPRAAPSASLLTPAPAPTPHATPSALHDAAEAGDVELLKQLLAARREQLRAAFAEVGGSRVLETSTCSR